MRILTWHVHGNYLYYLSQAPHDFYLPYKEDRAHPYGGRGNSFAFGDNVHELPAEDVCHEPFDLILFQSRANYEHDQYEILTPEQRRLPRVFLEHDPPREHPTDTSHVVGDPCVLVVHVTAFNRLMWNNGVVPTRVIEHGVIVPEDARYRGDLRRGLVAINNLASRGRRLGLDIFERMRQEVPLDLVGINSERLGGLGEVPPMEFPRFASRYRFFFNPIRYTSFGLAVCEAMTVGMPIVGLATCEMPTVIENGVNGYIDTEPEALVAGMWGLLDDAQEAWRLGENARVTALSRFGIGRFIAGWEDAFLTAQELSRSGVLEAAR